MNEELGAAALGLQASKAYAVALLCFALSIPSEMEYAAWKIQHGRLWPFLPGLENGPQEKQGKFREPPVLTCQGGIRTYQMMHPSHAASYEPSPNFRSHLSKQSTRI